MFNRLWLYVSLPTSYHKQFKCYMPLELKRGFRYATALCSYLLELTLYMDNGLEFFLLQTSVIFLALEHILLG
jgi:hypothetical protein